MRHETSPARRALVLGLAVVGLLSASAAFATANTCTTRALVAGQSLVVGKVEICPDNTVKYTITNTTYCLTEVHLAVASALVDIPQTSTGNPRPGRFEYGAYPKCTSTYTFDIAYPGVFGGDYVAAHAVVKNRSTLVKATAWAGEFHFAGSNWATYTKIPVTPLPTVATCSQCSGLECLLDYNIDPCAGGDVCTTVVTDAGAVRSITRACDTRANALAAAATNASSCENVENALLGTQTCTFVCDGVATEGCNRPPNLIPLDARLKP